MYELTDLVAPLVGENTSMELPDVSLPPTATMRLVREALDALQLTPGSFLQSPLGVRLKGKARRMVCRPAVARVMGPTDPASDDAAASTTATPPRTTTAPPRPKPVAAARR